MAKPLVAIKSNNTILGFGNLQKDDGISVENGGLGINYVAPTTVLLGNNSLPLKPLGLNKLNSSDIILATTNNNSILGYNTIKLEVQESQVELELLKGYLPFGRIGPAISDAMLLLFTTSYKTFSESIANIAQKIKVYLEKMVL